MNEDEMKKIDDLIDLVTEMSQKQDISVTAFFEFWIIGLVCSITSLEKQIGKSEDVLEKIILQIREHYDEMSKLLAQHTSPDKDFDET